MGVAVRRGKMDNDDDEEYVADEEDEEEVEEDEDEYVAAACSDEEEDDAEPEPDHESDADFDGDEEGKEAEDEDFEVEAPRPRRRPAAARPRGRGRKAMSEDESDADFEEELEIETPRPKLKRAAAKPRGRGRKAMSDDESDADFDEDEDELEIETPRPKRAAKARARGRKARPRRRDGSDADSDEEDELFQIEAPRARHTAKARGRGRKARPRRRCGSDADSDEPFQIEAPRPRRPAKARGRGGKAKKPRDDSDEDFGVDEGFEIEAPRQRRPTAVRSRGGGRKGKQDDESDEDFDVGEEELEIEARPAAVRVRSRGGGRKGKQEDDSDEDFDVGEEELEIEPRPAAVRSRGGRKGSQEDESDADFNVGEEELEDEELEIESIQAEVPSRGRKGKQEDESDADVDGEEELEEEELEIETCPAEVRSHGRMQKRDDESDADVDGEEELEDEELEDEELEIETRPAEVRSRGRMQKQDDESDADVDRVEELEEGLETEMPRPKCRNGNQDDEFDEDFCEQPEDQQADEELETEVLQPMQPVDGPGWGRKRKPSGSRRPRHEDDDDYEEEIEDEDEDFDPEVDEEEDDVEEEVEEDDEDLGEYTPTRTKKVRPRNHLAKRKPVAGRQHRNRRSGSRVSKGKTRRGTSAHQRRRTQWVADDDEEEDDDFVVNDDVEEEVDYRPRKKAKVGMKTRDGMAEPLAVGETWPSLESDTSEFEFVTSEEEAAENESPAAEPARIKRKKGRRKKGSESDSSSDSDYVISEEDLKDLGVPGPQDTVPQPLPPTARRTIDSRRVDEKGKEPEETLKQICGICLSEEQRATIQGVLNCCSHYFCMACILEWSKVESRCPLCKRRFNTITKSSVSDAGSGLRNTAIRVEKRDQVYQPTEEEMRRWLDPYENVVCIECNQGGEDNLMLLCDICDSSAHTFCVGLGREVPEGNWYCGGCRSSAEGPSYAQTPNTVVHRGESNMNTADSSSSSFGRPVSSGVFQRPPPLNIHPPSLQGFDLNLSPIETPDEDKRAESHISAEAVSTPTGRHATLDRRRALNRRIRILLFRPRTATNAWQNGLQHGRTTPGTEQNQRSTCTSTDVNPSCSRADLLQSQQSSSHVVQSASNLTRCSYEGGNNFREVENAKEQLIPIIKKSIKHICARSPLDQSSFMNVARRATNTILALSGIAHNRDRVVDTPFPFPSHCCHACDGREPAFLMRTICSTCFNSFVGDVVSHIANMFS